MFGKILSIVGLLFLGSQITSVSAEVCGFGTVSTDGCTLTGDCNSSNYGYYGVFKAADDGYTVVNDDKNNIDIDGILVRIFDDDGTTACEPVEGPIAYYKSTWNDATKYLKATGTGKVVNIATEDSDNACTTAAGSIKSDGSAVCIDNLGNSIDFGTYGHLISDTGSVFGGSKVVISSTNNIIKKVDLSDQKDRLVDDNGTIKAITYQLTDAESNFDEDIDYCVDENLIIWKRKEALCGAGSDCTYYTKDQSGWTKTDNNVPRVDSSTPVCDPADDNGTCAKGYHLVSGDITNSLYFCDGETGCGDDAISETSIPIGYLVNAGGEGYIKCEFSAGTRVCSSASVVAAGSSSSDDCKTVGGLYKDYTGGKINLCLDSTSKISIDLETTDDSGVATQGKYILPLGGSTSGQFGVEGRNDASYYISVEVDADGNVLVLKESSPVRYRYTATDVSEHTSTLYKIYNRVTAQKTENVATNMICDTTGAKPFEFMLVQDSTEWNDVYRELNTDVDYYVEGDNGDLTSSSDP